MAFIKHVGRHNDKKVIIVFREIPGEEHMALVVYSDTLPSSIHDTLINVLEGNTGQAADHLGDALNRAVLPDGRNVLHALHDEKFLKKAQTSQVIVTPTAKSSARLDEINSIIRDQKIGDDAAQRLADLEENAGLVDPTEKKRNETQQTADPMSDEGIAQSMIDQANRMAVEGAGLVAESERMLKEAYEMAPSLKPKRATSKKKPSKKVSKKTTVKKTATKQSV
jgi:hypothetical protein